MTLFDFLSLKNDVNVPSRINKQKKSGSGSGSISQRHGSADPDPDQPQNMSWIRNTAGNYADFSMGVKESAC